MRSASPGRCGVFEKIVIKLSGPICTCHEQGLSWSVTRRQDGGRSALVVYCESCKTELHVPHEKFGAGFSLETPYPATLEKRQNSSSDKEDDRPDLRVLEFPDKPEHSGGK